MNNDLSRLYILTINFKFYNISKIIGGLLAFVVFIFSAITYGLIGIIDEILFSIIMICPFIAYLLIFNRFVTRKVFRETAQLNVIENQLLISSKERIEAKYDKENITSLIFSYQGDNQWDKRKRYKVKRESAKRFGDSVDFIKINDIKYFVRIINHSDKTNFFKIRDWAKINEIKFKDLPNFEA
jgi:hypothetical protein